MENQSVTVIENAIVYFLNGGDARFSRLIVYSSGMLLDRSTQTVISPAGYRMVTQE